ncbi:hypothetical protein TSUD_173920 [Trifolium subterraneum]|nr:hypothetical protein TSUD_173920 [Trifolium subterraneum]
MMFSVLLNHCKDYEKVEVPVNDNKNGESESVLFKSLRRLELMGMSMNILESTAIEKAVNPLRKHGSKQVHDLTKILIAYVSCSEGNGGYILFISLQYMFFNLIVYMYLELLSITIEVLSQD